MITKGKTVRVLDPQNDNEVFGIVVDGPIDDCGGIFYTIDFGHTLYSLEEKEIAEVK